jgi:Aldehyde dehydrogenase family
MALESVNPATGQLVERFAEWTPETTAAVIDRIDAAGAAWRRTSFAERAALMRRVAQMPRSGLRQRPGQKRSPSPLRRRQGQRLRPGALPLRHPGIRAL